MTYNAPDTPHKGILHNQETDKNIIHSIEEIQDWCRITNIPCETLTTRIINTVNELYKCMDKSNMSHCKSLVR